VEFVGWGHLGVQRVSLSAPLLAVLFGRFCRLRAGI
jgi:hypothetical protein